MIAVLFFEWGIGGNRAGKKEVRFFSPFSRFSAIDFVQSIKFVFDEIDEVEVQHVYVPALSLEVSCVVVLASYNTP
jgi:hypothetical protein